MPDFLIEDTDFAIRSQLGYFEIEQVLLDSEDQPNALLLRFASIVDDSSS